MILAAPPIAFYIKVNFGGGAGTRIELWVVLFPRWPTWLKNGEFKTRLPHPQKLIFNKNTVTLRYRAWVSAKRKTNKQANNNKTQTNTNRAETNFPAQVWTCGCQAPPPAHRFMSRDRADKSTGMENRLIKALDFKPVSSNTREGHWKRERVKWIVPWCPEIERSFQLSGNTWGLL